MDSPFDDRPRLDSRPTPLGAAMTLQRFNYLAQTSLHHPLWVFQLSRARVALWEVIDACGAPAAAAFEAYCTARDDQDNAEWEAGVE